MEDRNANPLMRQRLEKLNALLNEGVNPYANDFHPTHSAGEIFSQHGSKDEIALATLEESFSVAGRIMALRSFGRAAFLELQDRTGRIQVFVKRDTLGAETFSQFRKMEVGDFAGPGAK